MKTLNIFLLMLLVLCSFAVASSEWQTSTYASQTGLQIVYPKLDFYKISDKNITFNFNVFDENNTHLENDTTQCVILIYLNNGSRIIYSGLYWDTINFFYNWNTTNYTTPQTFYYTVFCNQVYEQSIIAKGFTSNNFDINFDGKNPLTNTNYIPVVLILLGICFLFIIIANSLDEKHLILKLILMSFIVLFFMILGVLLLTIARGGDLSFYSLTMFKSTSWFLRVFIAYVLIFFILMIFEQLGALTKIKQFMRIKK